MKYHFQMPILWRFISFDSFLYHPPFPFINIINIYFLQHLNLFKILTKELTIRLLSEKASTFQLKLAQ